MQSIAIPKTTPILSGPVEKGLEGFVSLNHIVNVSQSSCLNEASAHTLSDLMKGGGDKWLESDSDEELLLHLTMNSVSRVRAIRFTTLPSVIAQGPKTIRIFVNNPTISFDDANSLEPAHEAELTESQVAGKEALQLRFVRFQAVTTISIFVKDNQEGGDITRIDKIELIGSEVNHTDVGKLDRGGHDHDN